MFMPDLEKKLFLVRHNRGFRPGTLERIMILDEKMEILTKIKQSAIQIDYSVIAFLFGTTYGVQYIYNFHTAMLNT